MRDIGRRLEKVEKKVQLIEKEENERKAKLLEIQKLGNDDSLEALMLKLELQHGCKLSIIDVIAMAGIQQSSEDSHGV
jgi:hypothetical protein